jgi:hypothetical protein
MRYFLCILVSLAWGMWLGGLVMTFLFINKLFETLKAMDLRDVFDQVAPLQFGMSERFELIVGMLALLSTVGLWLVHRTRAVTWLFVTLAVTAALAIVKVAWITPRMLKLIHPGQAPTPEFMKLHGLSMGAGSIEVLLLVLAAVALPGVFRDATLPPATLADAPR